MNATEVNDDELEGLIEEETLAQLRSEYPHAHYTLADGLDSPVPVVFKRLTDAQVKRAQGMLKDKLRADKMGPTVFKDIVVYPQGDALKELEEACPLLSDQVAALAMEIARGKAPEEAKKLRASSSKPARATRASTGVA